MIRRIFYVVLSIYLFCAGLLVIDPDRWADGRLQGGNEHDHAGLWPLPPEPPTGPVAPAHTAAAKPSPKAARSTTPAVHAGETLIKPPPAVRVVQGNLAAVHEGETLIEPPPPARVVQGNLAAVHEGETPIEPPPPVRVVQGNLAAVHSGETPIKPPPPVPIPARKPAPPSAVSSSSTDAVARQEPKAAKIAPTKEADPPANRNKRKAPEKAVTEKPRRIEIARAATEPTAPDLRRSQRLTAMPSIADKIRGRRMRAGQGDEVRRAVGQLSENDRRALRSRCGRILSAPGKFARSDVEICLAAAL